MFISNITPPQVWSASARSLTDIGSGALAPANTVFSTLAGAASVDLRTSAGIVGNLTVAVITGAGATGAIGIQLWDGTSTIATSNTAAAAASSTAFTQINCNTVGGRINNFDATHAGNYIVAQFLWTI